MLGSTKKNGVSNQKGLSLIELSIVLVISGLILVPLLFAAQIYMENYRREKLSRLEKVTQYVMKTYAERYFRYPCPALRPTSINPTAFGDGGESCSSAPVVSGARNAWASGSPNNDVMYGVLPEYTWEQVKQADGSVVATRIYLKDLIPTDEPIVHDFLDPWGGRLTYLVTKGLTNTSTFNPLNGTVSVVDENNRSTDGIDKNAHYALISHGSDMGGAVNRNGIISRPCPTSGVSELEFPNCNIGSQSLRPIVSGLIRKTDSARVVDVGGVAHVLHDSYNDYVFSNRFYEKSLWAKVGESDSSRVNLTSAPGNRVGIGVSGPQDVLDLVGNNISAGGDLRVDRALVFGLRTIAPNTTTAVSDTATGLLCTGDDSDNDGIIDENGNGILDASEIKCVNPLSFYKITCDDTRTTGAERQRQYIKSISINPTTKNFQVDCKKFEVRPPATGSPPQCGSGRVIRGIYSNGDIMCTTGNTADSGNLVRWE